MKLPFNPFIDAEVSNYEQYKKYTFIVFGNLELIESRIKQQITQIKNNYPFGERLLILGQRGIGKSSTLFFIKDLLDKNGIRNVLFSRLFEDGERFEYHTKQDINSFSKKDCYILIDFPDTLSINEYKKFLVYLCDILTHKNYNKINLIFALNKSHYNKSFSYSEILGKFMPFSLEALNLEETRELIESRLKQINNKISNPFQDEVLELIYSNSKGIPRNVISACNLLIDCPSGIITKKQAEKILKERYFEQILNDRIEDAELKRAYKQMIEILKNDFKGCANNQKELVDRTQELTGLGRNSIYSRIKELNKMGIFSIQKGGYNRLNKIISFI